MPSLLFIDLILEARPEIFKKIRRYFGRNNVLLKLFWFLLTFKEFSLESCRRRVHSLKLPGETDQLSVEDHYLKINSLINPLNENMIRAVGALLKYLDKNQIGGLDLEGGGGVPILAVKPFTPQEVVRVDETTLSALQIFNQRWQNSGKILQSKLLLFKNDID